MRSITHEGETIGYLGLIPFTELSHSGDLLFVEQQTESFVLITILMVGLSLLLTFPVTSHLLRPINSLTDGTRKLIAGHFKTRIPVTTGDELGRLSDDFNILAMTLEKNEKNRQLWVADISHELRTPLAVLRGEVEALQDGIRQPGPETIAALHGEIIHLERIVNDLYELTMSDIGALNYKRVEVNPAGILIGTIELFEQRVSQKGLELITDLNIDDSCSLLADPDRLQQLFSNLLENSLRYTDAPGKIKVNLEVGKELVSINFQDSSPGVTPAQLPRLFDRLYRVEGSRNRDTGGAGLGLAICKNIVDAHQGTINADSSPLGGVWIKIQLPLRRVS
ncbi:MAG: HAMP domain-containing protein [Proteobacteria bacterium]|nr:HAMP domain-containing protein [Pseudomonadota bacterium]MCG2744391.1 ATP-binding protein [Desulfobacteraceae bacterium]MBU4042120.1 HAMP domain-containing protein [Pseudomonadota bacterium]MBU4084897.1 HAMP domain-containing protein [Pseudomonadota bacterium]MBU4106332.1 HAMP domain-containing protein [Pseudomonadota bacterium]